MFVPPRQLERRCLYSSGCNLGFTWRGNRSFGPMLVELDKGTGLTDETVRRISLEVLGTDLYGIAQTLATLTRGMVSIEDDRSRVLAYSASDDTADELRRLSILGREGP